MIYNSYAENKENNSRKGAIHANNDEPQDHDRYTFLGDLCNDKK